MSPLPPPASPPESEPERPPETAEHWRRANRWLARAALIAAGFLLGALAALLVVTFDPTERDVPDRAGTVTVTQTVTTTTTATTTTTTTTEAAPEVPDVVGQETGIARDALAAAGYRVEVQQESLLCAIEASLCTVVSQDPPAGTRASAGSQVTIAIDNR